MRDQHIRRLHPKASGAHGIADGVVIRKAVGEGFEPADLGQTLTL